MLNIFHTRINVQSFDALVQLVRYRLVNTRKPRPPHFWAQKIQVVVRPTYQKRYDKELPQHLMCSKIFEKQLREEEEENPYQKILANELKDELFRSKMILVFHRNSTVGHIFQQCKIQFFKEGIQFFTYGKKTVQMAVENTKLENISRLFESHTMIMCGPEVKLNIAYQLLKNMPFFILLGGVIEDRFLDRNKLDNLSKIPNPETARSQLIATLNLTAANVRQLLLQTQMSLVSHLDHHIELQKKSTQPVVIHESERSD